MRIWRGYVAREARAGFYLEVLVSEPHVCHSEQLHRHFPRAMIYAFWRGTPQNPIKTESMNIYPQGITKRWNFAALR